MGDGTTKSMKRDSDVAWGASEERAAAVRFLRHWASLSGAFEDVAGRDLLNQFATRLEDREHLLPPGVTTTRDPSHDTLRSALSPTGLPACRILRGDEDEDG